MRIDAEIRFYCQTAGSQTEVAEPNDSKTIMMLKRKQDKLDKMRRKVTPYPEDQREILQGYGTSEGVMKAWETRGRSPAQQTRKEFVLQRLKETPFYSRMSRNARVGIIHQALREHERQVQEAAARGETIPFEVMKEYPGIFHHGTGLGAVPGHFFAAALTNAFMRDPTQTPTPDEIKKAGYKYAMKRRYPKVAIHVNPGPQIFQNISGMSAVIEKRQGKWHVFSEDGKKHLGGPYDSRERAAQRLQQIEYFKHRR